MQTQIHDAIIFATLKHQGQVRKGTDIPYIVHPMEVMQILTENLCSEDVIVAGILHDVLEDTNTTKAEILDKFGREILHIVESESEDKSKTWQERKQATLDHLAGSSEDIKLVCCADKLSNIRSMYCDLQQVGEVLWKRFNATKEQIHWYYSGIVEALQGLEEYPMYTELKALVEIVFVSP